MATKKTLHDIDECAGSHFDGSTMNTSDWSSRARLFVHAMHSCDRAVILTLDELGGLQLSSVPLGINQIVQLRKPSGD